MKHIIFSVLIAAIASVSCNNPGSSTSNQKLTVASDTASVKYQCPMKCQNNTSYTTEGKCPVCEMDLEKLK